MEDLGLAGENKTFRVKYLWRVTNLESRGRFLFALDVQEIIRC